MRSIYIMTTACLLSASTALQAQKPPYPPGPAALENITAIEWFVDHDPGIGNATPIAVTPATNINSLAAHLSVTGIQPGVHHLFIRSRDNDGNWSVTNPALFENLRPAYASAPAAATAINTLEIFFDHDPGIGKGSLMTITPATNTSLTLSVGVDTLAPGDHQLFARSLSNTWSLSVSAPVNNGVVLPLTWSYVRAELAGDHSVISWGTLQEKNTLRFEVEYSVDATNYHKIGSLPAAGNSDKPNDYSWTHNALAQGSNFYRIKQIDLDGKASWSRVVTVVYGSSVTSLSALPNPTRGLVTILLPANAGRGSLDIYNSAGMLVAREKVNVGERQRQLDLGRLAAGVYSIRFGTQFIRVVKIQ